MANWIKISMAVAMVLALILVGCAPKEAAPAAQETVKIGILGALTGPLRSIGEGAIGCSDYFSYLNETQGGIKYKDPATGKEKVAKVEVMLGDHAWDAAKCISLYERYKQAGMLYVYANGSAPAAAIYTACARDFIPGQQIDCTSDPFIYKLPEPYLALCAPDMPSSQAGIVAYYAELWRKAGNTSRPKIALLAADVATRRVYDNDKEFGFLTYCREVAKVDLIGPIYISPAPLDAKAELTRAMDGGANIILVDHWGDGACRVIIQDAIALGLHKKGIWLNLEWMGSNVSHAESALFKEYNSVSRVEAMTQGWAGTESPEIQAKYPGLKLAFDLCAKYHNGQTPADRGGYYYTYGVKEGIIGKNVIQQTLERTGFAGLSGKELRKTLFNLDPVDTGGLLPTFHPDKKVFMTWPMFTVVTIRDDGFFVCDPAKNPWVKLVNSRVYPQLNMTVTPEWQNMVYTVPGMPAELLAPK